MRVHALACLLGACAGPIVITGGPDRSTHSVGRASFGSDDLRPLVVGEPEALTRLDTVKAREGRGTVYLVAELGFLAPCVALPAADTYRGGALTWVGIGSCVGALVLGVAAVVTAPKASDYGDVLRTYNAHHRDAPWVAPDLDVR